jgi:hypothetical protein
MANNIHQALDSGVGGGKGWQVGHEGRARVSGGGRGRGQGVTLVHFSAQPETFLPMRPLNIAHKKCSHQAEKWTSVVHNVLTLS